MAESGLEVMPHTGPEIAPQQDGNMYCVGGGSNHMIFEPSDQSGRSQIKGQDRFRAFFLLSVIAVVCLALAIGLGLGAGLAAKHKPNLSSGAPLIGANASATSNTPVTITTASNAPVTSTPVTITQSNSAPVTTIQSACAPITITQSYQITTTHPTPVVIPPLECPAANGSTYVATNKPLPTIDPEWHLQIPQTSLSFEILCFTNFVQGTTNVQIFTNISSLNECLDKCALYNFRTSLASFPELGCTGIAFGNEAPLQQQGQGLWRLCFLKSGVTLATQNESAELPGYDGAVLLGF